VGTAVIGAAGSPLSGTGCGPSCRARWRGVRGADGRARRRCRHRLCGRPQGSARVAVVAAGTGLIAIGTDLTGWRRADGWGFARRLRWRGPGSGGRAWRRRCVRTTGGKAVPGPLLTCAEEAVRGDDGVARQAVSAPDRPAVLASFAPRVAEWPWTTRSPPASCTPPPGTWPESAAAVCPPDGEPKSRSPVACSRWVTPLVPLHEEWRNGCRNARRFRRRVIRWTVPCGSRGILLSARSLCA